MGGCTSSPVKTIKPRKSRRLRSRKTHKSGKLRKKNIDAGEPVVVIENVDTTTSCRESVSSDCTHEPVQMESLTSQIDAAVDEPWFDSVSSIEDSESDDGFSSVHGDDDPNGEDEMSSCFLDNKNHSNVDKSSKASSPTKGGVLNQANEFFILSSRGHDGDSSPSNKFGRSYSSYNCDKDVPHLFHSASFHDNITNTSNSGSQNQTRKPAVIKLAVKRTDGEDLNGTRATEKFFYRPRAGFLIPCCTDEKPTPGCWSAIDPSTFTLRSENYFKYPI